MKILVIGKNGQLAQALVSLSTVNVEIICLGREQIDISDKSSLLNTVTEQNVDAVINACAYTAVDLAEKEPEQAYKINTLAVKNLAEVCKELSLHFVQISTDFVFNGLKSSPYVPNDDINPLSVYGKTKAQGEQLLTEIIPESSCIIRTSWVYSCYGNNFVKSMIRLMAEKPELGIICDQIGTPTYVKGLAQVSLTAAVERVSGIHHWTDAGVASWYDFSVAIQELAIEKGLLVAAIPIKPINTKSYPTPATRPSYSVLDKSSSILAFPNSPIIHWRKQLGFMLDELQNEKEETQS
jgi:dTDP-4-dehydrorhamnose reductase